MVVLGMKWLETLGPIIWDFSKMSMQFVLGQKRVELQGLRMQPPYFEWENKEIRSSLAKGKGLFLQLCGEMQSEVKDPTNPEISSVLLKDFAAVFEQPKGLSPPHSHDHIITLREVTEPISTRSYHNPYY